MYVGFEARPFGILDVQARKNTSLLYAKWNNSCFCSKVDNQWVSCDTLITELANQKTYTYKHDMQHVRGVYYNRNTLRV